MAVGPHLSQRADFCGLPDGVIVHPLVSHADSRGALMEIFREEWSVGERNVQLNVATSAANVLRGVHVHVEHSDYLVILSGRMIVGLHDLRPQSASSGKSAQFELSSARPFAVVIPPGVAHGFCFTEPSLHFYGVSDYWSDADEFGCRWDAPELGIAWPVKSPILSKRDTNAPTYVALTDSFGRAWRSAHGMMDPGRAA